MNEDTGISLTPENLITFLKWKLHLKDWLFNVLKFHNNINGICAEWNRTTNKNVMFMIPNIKNNKKIITEICSKFGYYLGNEHLIKNNKNIPEWYILNFLPIYTEPIKDVPGFIYHITPETNKQNILQNGFICKDSKKDFIYPKRIHFFLTNDDALLFSNELKQKFNTNTFVIFTVNTLNIKTCFYNDPNMENAIITKENINKETIENVEEIEL